MRINDTDKNRLSQNERWKWQFGYPWVSVLASERLSDCVARFDSQRLGPGPRPPPRPPPVPKRYPRDRPSRWNPRSEPAVRPRRARRPDSRHGVLDLPAADRRVVLRDQRQGHLPGVPRPDHGDRKSTRLNSSHGYISYAVFCLKKKKRCD